MTETEARERLRGQVREVCGRFPDDYWRGLDEKREYPEEFVRVMTEVGLLGALIPEEYGGMGVGIAEASVVLEE
ncbi:MAG: acyl-CoA dehydrogenase family protein, partial [Rubrobacter sp.]